jgi:hypothetical protein
MFRNRSKRLTVESLENRCLLAGNVSASLSGSDLNITGDDLGNTISVESIGAGQVQVRGFGTSINGSPDAIKTFNVSGSINIHMNDGADLVRVTNLVIHDDLVADLGPGANELLLGQSTAGDNTRFASTPSGPLYVQNDVTVVGNTAADRVFQSNLHVGGVGTLDLGSGDDTVQLERPSGSTANVEYAGLFQVLPGAGNDSVSITGLVVDDNMVVTDGSGIANVSINSMDVHGNLTITTANLADTIGIQNTNVRNTLTVVSQGGYDSLTLSAIADNLTVNAGGGNDEVHVSSANIGVLRAFMGTGTDHLDLLSDTTDQIFAYGSDGNDLFQVRNTRAIDAFFNGDAGDDTYEDSLLLANNISNLQRNSIEHVQHV